MISEKAYRLYIKNKLVKGNPLQSLKTKKWLRPKTHTAFILRIAYIFDKLVVIPEKPPRRYINDSLNYRAGGSRPLAGRRPQLARESRVRAAGGKVIAEEGGY